jgi:hypothetical protein
MEMILGGVGIKLFSFGVVHWCVAAKEKAQPWYRTPQATAPRAPAPHTNKNTSISRYSINKELWKHTIADCAIRANS